MGGISRGAADAGGDAGGTARSPRRGLIAPRGSLRLDGHSRDYSFSRVTAVRAADPAGARRLPASTGSQRMISLPSDSLAVPAGKSSVMAFAAIDDLQLDPAVDLA